MHRDKDDNMANVTMEEIAKKLNISLATVSLAMNNRPNVNKDTKKLVIKTAKEMGYDFGKRVRNEKKHLNITLITIKDLREHDIFSDNFFMEVLEGINFEIRKMGFNLIYTALQENPTSMDELPPIIHQRQTDGILILGYSYTDKMFDLFDSLDIPYLVLDNNIRKREVNCVYTDSYNGTYNIVNHLINLGYKHIGIIRSKERNASFLEREQAYLDALNDAGLPTCIDQMPMLACSIEGSCHDMLKYIEKNKEKLEDAYFASNDGIGIGAIKALSHYNIKVPEDIAFVGFDDLSYISDTVPKLTTVKYHKQELGKMAVRILRDIIEENIKVAVKTMFSNEIVIRESCNYMNIMKNK